MRKRLVVAGALLLLVVGTALIAGNYLAGSGKGDGMVNGNHWEYTTSFQGRVICLNPDGTNTNVGMVTLQGDPSQGEVNLTVSGSKYTFKGVGRHEVRCSHTGELLGYVNMTPAPSEQELEKEWGSGTCGQRSTPQGSEGYDKDGGYSWKLQGAAKVTIENPDGTLHGTVESRPSNAPSVPELAIDTKLGKVTKQGFGTHEVPGEDGKPVARLIIEPASAPK